jgi:hypothetical protein
MGHQPGRPLDSAPPENVTRRRHVLLVDITQAASEVSRLVHEARDRNLPVEPGVRGRAKRARPLSGSSSGGAAMTEPHKLTDLVPVDVLTAVTTAIAVLEIQGPAITEALQQLDRATTMAWKAVNMLGVTDDEWELVKRELGIARAWDAAYQLVSTFDLPSMQPSADVTADGP